MTLVERVSVYSSDGSRREESARVQRSALVLPISRVHVVYQAPRHYPHGATWWDAMKSRTSPTRCH